MESDLPNLHPIVSGRLSMNATLCPSPVRTCGNPGGKFMNVSSVRDEIIFHKEGIVATRSASEFVIRLPRAVSADQQLGIIAVLWDICMDARQETCDKNIEYTIKIELEEEPSLPLIVTIYAIGAELEQLGRRLLVVGHQQIQVRAVAEM